MKKEAVSSTENFVIICEATSTEPQYKSHHSEYFMCDIEFEPLPVSAPMYCIM
jgi:hypothetical protein